MSVLVLKLTMDGWVPAEEPFPSRVEAGFFKEKLLRDEPEMTEEMVDIVEFSPESLVQLYGATLLVEEFALQTVQDHECPDARGNWCASHSLLKCTQDTLKDLRGGESCGDA